MKRRSVWTASTTVVAALILSATPAQPAQSQRGDGPRRNLDVVSSAHPGGAYRAVTDTAYRFRAYAAARTVKADATATASSTCDGCTGDARTVQVVYLRSPRRATVDNVATAWSQCRDCGATALSVQIVVVRRPQEVKADNRALAMNAACSECVTAAAAYQLVVSSRSLRPMSGAERRALRRWVDEQAAQMEEPSGQPHRSTLLRRDSAPAPVGDRALDSLDRLVTDQLGSTTLRRAAEVRSH